MEENQIIKSYKLDSGEVCVDYLDTSGNLKKQEVYCCIIDTPPPLRPTVDNPKTGDSSITLYVVVAILAFIALLFVKKK